MIRKAIGERQFGSSSMGKVVTEFLSRGHVTLGKIRTATNLVIASRDSCSFFALFARQSLAPVISEERRKCQMEAKRWASILRSGIFVNALLSVKAVSSPRFSSETGRQ